MSCAKPNNLSLVFIELQEITTHLFSAVIEACNIVVAAGMLMYGDVKQIRCVLQKLI